jgi:hypothetical protein
MPEVTMKAEFSLFSYAAALLRELPDHMGPGVCVASLLSSPVLAVGSDAQEDVQTSGWPVFLHFRLAQCMITPRAQGWSAHEERFFRVTFSGRAQPRRHELLRHLAQRYPQVYYVLPAFYRQRDFGRAFAMGRILQESRFIPASQLPAVGEEGRQYLTYRGGEKGFRWHSGEAQYSDLDVSGAAWLAQMRELVAERRLLGWRFLLALRQDLVELLTETTRQPSLFDDLAVDIDDVTPRTVVRDLEYLLVAQFGVQALILRPL